MIENLIAAITTKNAPIVVGLDPTPEIVPDYLLQLSINQLGECAEAVADCYYEFNTKIIDAIADIVPAIKPNAAMYERFGIAGMVTLQRTIEYAHDAGLCVISDVKRGDIGSTSENYAKAWLGKSKIGNTMVSGFDSDFATVNPYLGTDGIKPFADVCKEDDRGIFTLVKTSNPSSGEFQDREIDGRPLYEHVAEKVEEWGADLMHGDYSDVGAVVGATYPEMGAKLRNMMPHAYILVPGYGAQGGKGEDLKAFFNKDGLGAIVNSSRGIIAAYKKGNYSVYGDMNYADAARQACIDMREDIKEHALI